MTLACFSLRCGGADKCENRAADSRDNRDGMPTRIRARESTPASAVSKTRLGHKSGYTSGITEYRRGYRRQTRDQSELAH